MPITPRTARHVAATAAVLAFTVVGCGNDPTSDGGTQPAPRDTAHIDAARTARAADTTQRDLRDLAVHAAASLDRRPPSIATSPAADGSGCITAWVGEPVWFWDTTPWRPVTESVTTPYVTVIVTAAVDHITWATGDGATITCTTGGTPHPADSPNAPRGASPGCGHTYTEATKRHRRDSPAHRHRPLDGHLDRFHRAHRQPRPPGAGRHGAAARGRHRHLRDLAPPGRVMTAPTRALHRLTRRELLTACRSLQAQRDRAVDEARRWRERHTAARRRLAAHTCDGFCAPGDHHDCPPQECGPGGCDCGCHHLEETT